MVYSILALRRKGTDMLNKLNRLNGFLRKIVLVICAVCVIFKLTDRRSGQMKKRPKVFRQKNLMIFGRGVISA